MVVGWLSNKMPCQLGVSKFINLIPSHHTEIPRFNAHLRFKVNCVIRWNQTMKKEDPSLLYREDGGIRWLSAMPPKLYVPPYLLNGWRTADWVVWGTPLLKAVEGAANLVHPSIDQEPTSGAHIPTWIYSEALSCCKPQWLRSHWLKWWPHQNLKAEVKHCNKHQHKEIVGGSTLKRKLIWRGPMA